MMAELDMSNPLVTIISPTYNHQQYIGECIRSVLAQTYSHWEMMIVDDGSTDRTVEIARSFTDARITIISKEHGGIERLGESYNLALKQSQGEFIAILEGDDVWPQDKLAVQIGGFNKQDVVLSWGRFFSISDDGNQIREIPATPILDESYLNNPIGSIQNHLFLVNHIVPAVSVMIRRSALDRIGGFWQPDGVVFVDYSTWLKLALIGKFSFIDSNLGMWRIHSSQMSIEHKYAMFQSHGDAIQQFLIAEKTSIEKLAVVDLQRAQGAMNWYWGKANLGRSNWSKACSNFLIAVRTLPIRWKVKSVVGYLAGLLHSQRLASIYFLH